MSNETADDDPILICRRCSHICRRSQRWGYKDKHGTVWKELSACPKCNATTLLVPPFLSHKRRTNNEA